MIRSWREKKKRERVERDKFIGKPVQRPYCQINGHSFINSNCVICGKHR